MTDRTPTWAQRQALHRILRAQSDLSTPASLSGVVCRISMIRTLQAFGWIERLGDFTVRITPAGLAWIQGKPR